MKRVRMQNVCKLTLKILYCLVIRLDATNCFRICLIEIAKKQNETIAYV